MFAFFAIVGIFSVNVLPAFAQTIVGDSFFALARQERFFIDDNTNCTTAYNCSVFTYNPTQNFSATSIYLPVMKNSAESTPPGTLIYFDYFVNSVQVGSIYTIDIDSIQTGIWQDSNTYGCAGQYDDLSCFTKFPIELDIQTGNVYEFRVSYDRSLGFFPPKAFHSFENFSSSGLMDDDSGNTIYFAFSFTEEENLFNFFGTTTPIQVFDTVAGGVRDTSNSLWPILTLLGIPTGFVIGGRVVSIIRLMV